MSVEESLAIVASSDWTVFSGLVVSAPLRTSEQKAAGDDEAPHIKGRILCTKFGIVPVASPTQRT